MAWTPTTPELGTQPIALTSTTQQHDLGRVITARDPIYGEGEFIYLLGVVSTVVGSVVTWSGQTTGTPTYQSALAAAAVNQNAPLAVAMSANVAAQYGWYQIAGQALVATNGTLAINSTVFLAGSGQLTTTVAAGAQVMNASSITATGTPAANQAVVEIQRPFAQGGQNLSAPIITGPLQGIAVTVAAAGATQGTATAIPASAIVVNVTTTTSAEGVKLPTASTGRVIFLNGGGGTNKLFKVYGGAAGQLINAGTTATTAFVMASLKPCVFLGISATRWVVIKSA